MSSIRTIFLDARSDWRSERQALKANDAWYTYEELAVHVESIASTLSKSGIKAGDIVGQVAENSFEMIVNIFAVFRIGAVYCPLSRYFSMSELTYRIEHSGLNAVIADEENYQRVSEIANTSSNHDFMVLPVNLKDDFIQNVPLPDVKSEQPILLLYTSGSTGLPKGCLLSEKNLLVNATQVINRTQLTREDRILHQMPLHHTNGINNNLIAPFLAGAQVVLGPRFYAPELFSILQKERPTYFTGVPTMYYRLIKEPIPEGALDSLRFVRCGSAPLSVKLEREIEDYLKVPVITSYGLTEGTCTSTMTPIDEKKYGSVGKPMSGQEVRIISPATGEFLPVGEEGEVVVRGENLMLGYYKNPEATEKTLRDGWLYTGDLGRVDEEGYLFLSDRIKDLIVRGGENVSPKEIEESLSLHEDIDEVAVVGIKDEEYGEIPVAFIVSNKSFSHEELKAYSMSKLSRFKVPERFIQVNALPRNALGKVERSKLVSKAQNEKVINK
ncbi:class I adenylate-forming enzyme family protein [Bacillus sp. JJ1533]|uniref:class I adenylate-forming enzyme family protein n=1 Tax=Bacillus sp. JJ1533 TaxID=3122959 RepID=UPI002FFEFAE5